MKITSLTVDGFGVWNGLEFKKLDAGLNVFCGLNEAGKSTLMQFIRSMLYGFEGERHRYLPPVYGGRPGGRLQLSDTSGHFVLTRHDDERDMMDHAKAIVQSPDGTQAGESLLQTLLSDVDEATFNNVFAVGLQEMQELGTLSDSEAAEMLFRLSAGVDRVSIVEVLGELANSRAMLFDPEANSGRIPTLIAQRDHLIEELEQFATTQEDYGRLAGLRNGLDHESAELQKRVDRLQEESRTLEIAINLRDQWQKRDELDQRIARYKSPVTIPSNIPTRLRELAKKRHHYRQRIEEIKQQRRDLRTEASQRKVNTKLIEMAPRIEAFSQQLGWINSLQARTDQLETEINETKTALDAERNRLGIARLTTLVPTFSTEQVKRLRRTAKKLARTEQEHEEAERRHRKAQAEAEKLAAESAAAMNRLGETNLNEAMDRTGSLINQLRRRAQLDDQVASLQASTKELDAQTISLVKHQLMPMGTILALGMLFVGGVVLGLVGMFVSSLGMLGWGLTGLSVVVVVAVLFTKVQIERSNAKKLDSAQRQLQMVQAQHGQAIEQRNQLDAQLPSESRSASDRLEEAQRHLTALEALQPAETRRRAAAEAASEAETKMRDLEYQLAGMGQRWGELLVAHQLPEDLSPGQVRLIVGQSDRLHELDQRIRRATEELDRNRQDYAGLVDRVTQLATEAGVSTVSSDPCDILQSLQEQVQAQQQIGEKRTTLQARWRQLGRRVAKHEKAVRRMGRKRRKILDELNLKDENELQEKLQRQVESERLLEEQFEIEATIESAIAGHCNEQTITRLLATEDDDTLASRWDTLEGELTQARTRLTECLEEKGRLAQKLEDIAKDRSTDRKRLELGTVEKQLDEMVERWQVLALTESILRSIKTHYEEERQPETLKEASDYLRRLTNGRYIRIWTPFGEDTLLVDDAMGNVLPVDVLSRGTREQLFLALRLALVGSYAERGVTLPLVLDDVLVNFDTPRARAAADVLNDFTRRGHQVFIFTCHDHVYHMFQDLKVDVRMLPSHTAQDAKGTRTAAPKKQGTTSRRSVEPSSDPAPVEEPVEVPPPFDVPEAPGDPPPEEDEEAYDDEEDAEADDAEACDEEDEDDEEYYEYDFDEEEGEEEDSDDEEDEDYDEEAA